MPRKAYIADLKRLSTDSGTESISDVRSGDDDGEFRFKVAPDANGAQYEISALIPDVSEYPDGHMYHIFVADDNAPAHVSATLDDLPNTMGVSLAELLEVVSRAFSRDRDGDTQMIDSQYDEEESEADYSEDDFFGEDGGAAARPFASTANNTNKLTPTSDFRTRIRSDLKFAKQAGFKVGHQGPLLDGSSSYVSISCRISKLGISEEAMQAWELEPSEYLILLVHYPNGYKSVESIKAYDAATARRNIDFRVGISKSYKPTLQEAISAFTRLSSEEEAKAQMLQAKADATSGIGSTHNHGFRNSFISRPLNELLNERLPTIIKYRYIGMQWTGAEEFYNDNQGKTYTVTGELYMDNKYMTEDPINPAFPPIVTGDHILESKPTDPHSLPLLAMQFLLRHFVRCTEFCLVCHCKLENDLEALKPYVCDKPLCLYQYMSLGFGPSIEHEIISQPYVVDLLISFCYHSAVGGKLGAFPNGLSLNVPPPKLFGEYQTSSAGYYAYAQPPVPPTPSMTPGPPDTDGHKVKFCSTTREMLFEKDIPNPVKVGDWLCFPQVGSSDAVLQHCRVMETHFFPVIKVTEPISKPPPYVGDSTTGYSTTATTASTPKSGSSSKASSKASTGNSSNKPGLVFEEITFHVYNTNFDDLTDQQKRGAIISQLELLPGVIELKDYLTRNRMATLSTWTDRISPTASGILRWIIASNRACIVQVDDPDYPEKNRDDRLHGMEGWMQFRFAMGAPDKERRFMTSVQSTKERLRLAHPTLFAWHGSPLMNWHSIIREGLHYRDIAHGRAFGNGCYHSLDFNTSYGYSGMYNRGSGFTPNTWPASGLKVSCALALNEIVNAPTEFTSRTPHLVVAQLDWIQTRYLFVQCHSDLKLSDSRIPDQIHPQDPSMTPSGQKGKIIIPLNAMPKSRRGDLHHNKGRAKKKLKASGSSRDPIPIDLDDDDAASIDTDIEDLNILIEEENFVPAPTASGSTSAKGKEPSFMSGLKSLVSKAPKPSKPMTDFQPGTLDYSTLTLLAQPSWSTNSATKRLQKEFQTLIKVQESQPLHELGWYTDPEQFSNVYQWIVELHSFEQHLPLAKQMKQKGIKSVVMEMRFGPDYPMSPPFVRVIRPRFLGFQVGGGGHVTAGGSICMELLTNSGWSAVSSIESVLLQVRLAMSSTEPRPAQLDTSHTREYGISESIDAYIRACHVHGWAVPPGFRETAMGGQPASGSYY